MVSGSLLSFNMLMVHLFFAGPVHAVDRITAKTPKEDSI
jgi:hypothetical protein